MKIHLTQRYTIRAIHQISGHKNFTDKEKNIHGHDYKVEVTCKGKVDLDSGLLLDRHKMNDIVHKTLVRPYDKSLLNKHFEITTGEILCYIFFQKLSQTELGSFLHEVRIQETHKNSFAFRKDFVLLERNYDSQTNTFNGAVLED